LRRAAVSEGLGNGLIPRPGLIFRTSSRPVILREQRSAGFFSRPLPPPFPPSGPASFFPLPPRRRFTFRSCPLSLRSRRLFPSRPGLWLCSRFSTRFSAPFSAQFCTRFSTQFPLSFSSVFPQSTGPVPLPFSVQTRDPFSVPMQDPFPLSDVRSVFRIAV
jgi:hypothetical protein